MKTAINAQINREMFSSFLYMSMSSHCAIIGLKGFSNWFMVQYHEEMVHSMKFYEYLIRHGEQPIIEAIAKPASTWKSALEMLEKTLEHEHFITKSIYEIMDLAIAEKDHASQTFLQWYVNEQVEEEDNDNTIIQQLKLIKDDVQALIMLDKDLAARMVTVPTDFSKGVEAALKGASAAP